MWTRGPALAQAPFHSGPVVRRGAFATRPSDPAVRCDRGTATGPRCGVVFLVSRCSRTVDVATLDNRRVSMAQRAHDSGVVTHSQACYPAAIRRAVMDRQEFRLVVAHGVQK